VKVLKEQVPDSATCSRWSLENGTPDGRLKLPRRKDILPFPPAATNSQSNTGFRFREAPEWL